MKFLIVLFAVSMPLSCVTESIGNLTQIEIYPVKAPVAGNYPQGLYKYPYKAITLKEEKFTQTLDWTPTVNKTFAVDTQYTASITLDPVSRRHSFNGITLNDIKGLPLNGLESGGISIEYKGRSLVIKIKFEKTDLENAQRELVFFDDFDGNALDFSKWDLCPEWDRQGRSTWKDDMVLVGGGNLHLLFRRDGALGRSKTSDRNMADNWIRAGAIRSRKKDGTILFENGYGYYEARVKFPVVSGTWGAFWLMSPTQWVLSDEGMVGTEIDIVETIFNHQGEYNAALHWNGYGDNHKSTGSDGIRTVNIYDGEFHIFALDWSPSEYIFYIDGQEFWRVNGGSNFNNSGINRNMNYIKLTVESANWAGDIPPDFSEGEMLVDYVRVYNQP